MINDNEKLFFSFLGNKSGLYLVSIFFISDFDFANSKNADQ
jgi:hypothetical protein